MRYTAFFASFLAVSAGLAQGFDIFTLPHNGVIPSNQSFRVNISRDGRYTTFVSGAANLPLGGPEQLYLTDRVTKALEPLSLSLTNGPGNGASYESSISDTGRFVAFESEANNLVLGDDPNRHYADIFIRDRTLQTTQLITRGLGGVLANEFSYESSISGDGRFVAFTSWANNLVPNDTNGQADGFVFDRVKGTMRRVTLTSSGVQAPMESRGTSISQDGTKVFFETQSALVPEDTNNYLDIYVRDLMANTTRRISLGNSGQQGIYGATYARASSDCRFITFVSSSPDLVEGDTNGHEDVFLRDDWIGTTELISVSNEELQANASTSQAEKSGNGRFVTFPSTATNLVANDTNGARDIFLRDVERGTTTLLSRSTEGVLGNQGSLFSVISANGRHLAFTSFATNLVNPHPPKGMRSAAFGVDLSTKYAAGNLQVVRGAVLSGNLQSIVSSDNSHLIVQPGPTLTQQQSPIEIVVSTISEVVEPRSLEFWIESRASAATIAQNIELFDFDSNTYVLLSSQQMTTIDRVVSVQVDDNADRFVGGSGEMRARLRYKANGPVLVYPWDTKIDHVRWAVMD